MEARFDSRCQSCGERIHEGDEIFKDEDLDAWVCEGCEPPPLRVVKPKAAGKLDIRKGPSLADQLEAKVTPPPVWQLEPFERGRAAFYVGAPGHRVVGPFEHLGDKKASYELRHKEVHTQLYLPFSVIVEVRREPGAVLFVVRGNWVGFEMLQQTTERDAKALKETQELWDRLFK